jgi:hypothetical protein
MTIRSTSKPAARQAEVSPVVPTPVMVRGTAAGRGEAKAPDPEVLARIRGPAIERFNKYVATWRYHKRPATAEELNAAIQEVSSPNKISGRKKLREKIVPLFDTLHLIAPQLSDPLWEEVLSWECNLHRRQPKGGRPRKKPL